MFLNNYSNIYKVLYMYFAYHHLIKGIPKTAFDVVTFISLLYEERSENRMTLLKVP